MKLACGVSSRELFVGYGFIEELAQRLPALTCAVPEETAWWRSASDQSVVFLIDLFGISLHVASEVMQVSCRPAAAESATRVLGISIR